MGTLNQNPNFCFESHTRKQLSVCICRSTFVHFYVYIILYVYIYIHECTYMSIHMQYSTYIQIYIHTCMHTYIDICIGMEPSLKAPKFAPSYRTTARRRQAHCGGFAVAGIASAGLEACSGGLFSNRHQKGLQISLAKRERAFTA